MKTPIHRDARLDNLDAEQFGRMLESKAWRLYIERRALEWRRVTALCASEDDEIKLRRAQGAAAALQAEMATPKAILDELRRQAAAKRARAAE